MPRGYCLPVLVLAVTSLLSACGDDKPEQAPQPRSQQQPLQLQLESEPGQLHFSWDSDDEAHIVFSSDPQCDWQNYTQCPDNGIMPDQSSPVTITEQDGFELNRAYYFVLKAPGQPMQVVEGILQTEAADTEEEPELQGFAELLATVDGDVLALARDAEERWYIGGLFRSIAGQPIRNLARLTSDGRLDTQWQVSPDATVAALTVMGERLYVGGDFRQIANEERTRLAAFNTDNGRLTAWQPHTNLAVMALAADDGIIYAGGWFTFANDQVRHRIASFTVEGDVTADFKPLLNGHVRALAVHDNTLYTAGGFTLIDEARRGHLAALDTGTGRLLPWAPGVQGSVQALLANERGLYAGGSFSSVAEEPYPQFAVFDLFSGELAEAMPDHQGLSVNAMALADDELYLFGQSRQLLVLDIESAD